MQKLIQNVQSVISKSGGEWGIVFEDLQTGETWENHAEQVFIPASVIKLPVMAAIFSKAHQNELDLSDTITLQQDDMVGGSGVLQHMTPGTEISLDDLITLMIIQSDNTATNILIDLASTASINQLMEKIGMHHSVINRKLMLSDTNIPPNQMTSGILPFSLKSFMQGKLSLKKLPHR
ncbi:serine hydrolase [Virgibacillus sp. 179-BFC.A HS]|uniref:Serine hydrolase n=1 Tax=Tigheibacillus jepli TaxID=3035914 RepID=A0ABU5CF56_9BACI|nr:serine hydrolase [Virgibacillus sp. 179-BFC.A HS]MDY0404926.1 serine hydrolase [Virgibacillus sp. 179-BFC.A HS]